MVKTPKRDTALRTALTARRHEMLQDVRERMRDGRTDHQAGVSDTVDLSDAMFQQEIDMKLLQMQGETLMHIDEALVRLDAGRYGRCGECSKPIAEARLRALPFAVRCRDCEEQREEELGRDRQNSSRSAMPFSHLVG